MGSYQAHLDAQRKAQTDTRFMGLVKAPKPQYDEVDPRRRRREGSEFQEEMDQLIQSEQLMGV